MELDAKRSLQSELSFSNLPAELRVKIWETALEDREGRVIVPTLECIQPPHSSNATGIDCRCTGPEVRRSRLSYRAATDKAQASYMLSKLYNTTLSTYTTPRLPRIARRR
jgi:hypothetical protein